MKRERSIVTVSFIQMGRDVSFGRNRKIDKVDVAVGKNKNEIRLESIQMCE